MSTDPPPKRHPYNQWAPDARALDLVGDKWTLLIIRDLAAGARRFVELQRVLPGISTEQLRSRLKRMVADGLLTRERFREVPPRVEYALTERAYDLLPVVGALARWGQAWAWSPPREGEAIDISAVFRAAPGLLAPDRKLSGEIELSVGGASRPSVIEFRDGRATVSERAAPNASARVARCTPGVDRRARPAPRPLRPAHVGRRAPGTRGARRPRRHVAGRVRSRLARAALGAAGWGAVCGTSCMHRGGRPSVPVIPFRVR